MLFSEIAERLKDVNGVPWWGQSWSSEPGESW